MSIAELVHQHTYGIAVAAAMPWIVGPIITFARLARSRTLGDESADVGTHPVRVSVIIPARNEAHNIRSCVDAVLASTYPALDVIVVNDHSADGTASIVREIAAHDSRLHVIDNPDLPEGWFGKQWACQNGANTAVGEILIFLDADTRVAPELIARSVNGMHRTKAELYTVIGQQEMHTFWEKLIQPQIFTTLATRYGGTEAINRSRSVWDKIASGQYLMMRRASYDALGGHARVRHHVAEDLMLAQQFFAAGYTTVVVGGWEHLSTRMYTSLRELIDGWGKNVYAGGREAVPLGRVGQILFPFMLPAMPLVQLVPPLVLLASLAGLLPVALTLWAATATVALLGWWLFVYRINNEPLRYAFYFPLGAVLLLYIFVSAIARGDRVAWKGRQYVSRAGAGSSTP